MGVDPARPEADKYQQLRLLKELCRELARLGLSVGMSDARPSVVLWIGVSNHPMEVTADPTGSFFEWYGGRERHTAGDPIGAAARIRESLRRRAEPDESPWPA